MDKSLTGKAYYQALFEEFENSLNGHSKTPIHQVRQQAMQSFSEMGFPTTRQEEWRFTDMRSLEKSQFLPVTAIKLELEKIHDYVIDATFPRMVFVNGELDLQLSTLHNLPSGLTVKNVADMIYKQTEQPFATIAALQDNPFVALNTAFIQQGAFVSVAKNTFVEKPLHLIYITHTKADALTHPRNYFYVDAGAELSIIESYIHLDSEAYFTNAVSEIMVQENAVLHYYKFEHESKKSYHTSFTQVQQAANSQFHSHQFNFGGKLVRNEVNTKLNGEGADCTLNGLSLINGRQHVDNHTKIEHVKAHCTSNELYKGIMDDQAHAVFGGKIHVHPDAQKTDAMQSSQNLLLSDKATVNTKPQLEIYADDVRCTHGSTVGQLDESGMFYLRTRGIGEETAKNIMIQAFAGQVTNEVRNSQIREHVENLVHAHLIGGHLE